MTRSANHLFVVALAAFFSLGQAAYAAQAGQTPVQTSAAQQATPANNTNPHGPVPAELTKALDSKKLKEGDPVTARVTAELHMRDGGVIPRGSTLVGHVTEAKARSKGDPQAELGFVFDKIMPPAGKEMVIKGVLQAVGPNPSQSSSEATVPPSSDPTTMSRTQTGGMDSGTVPPPMPPLDTRAPRSPAPVLTAQSKGVVGIKNLELGENSLLLSKGKEVKLDSGTQMIVAVEIQVPVE